MRRSCEECGLLKTEVSWDGNFGRLLCDSCWGDLSSLPGDEDD